MRLIFAALLTCCASAQAQPTTVYVIGDSISLGYTDFLAYALGPDFAVTHSRRTSGNRDTNARHTGYSLEHIDELLPPGSRFDVIVCNWGLHDLRFDGPGPVATPQQYAQNLQLLLARAQQHADIVIVPSVTWVTPAAQRRTPERCLEYARILEFAARGAGLPVVPMYDITVGCDEWYLPDGTHLTPFACDVLGQIIAAEVLEQTNTVEVPAASPWLAAAAVLVATLARVRRREYTSR
jgi:lysophospholipase L1-like esterase